MTFSLKFGKLYFDITLLMQVKLNHIDPSIHNVKMLCIFASFQWSHCSCVYCRSERELLDRTRDNLMKKLVEVEMDGQAAAKQVAALRDTIRRLREVRSLKILRLEFW